MGNNNHAFDNCFTFLVNLLFYSKMKFSFSYIEHHILVAMLYD